MKIVVLAVGKTSTGYIADAVADFVKRASRHVPTEFVALPDAKPSKGQTEEMQKRREGQTILSAISGGDSVVLLDERGKMPTSREFAGMIEQAMNRGLRRLVMVIGGPYGFSKEVYDRADSMLALSRMTFTHEMVRLFLAEQIYRATAIMHGEPYHHD